MRSKSLLVQAAFVTLASLCAVGARAESIELVTDRPDQTESSAIVPPGFVQFEVGWSREREDDGGADIRSDAFPATLTRIGVLERLELRLGHAGHIWESAEGPGVGDGSTDGLGDAEIGAKVKLWEERAWRPDAALLAGLSLPTGDDAFTSDRADPAFRFSLAHTLSERASLGYNLGAAWASSRDDAGNEETVAVLEYTATVGLGLSDRVGSFVEIFGDAPASDDAPDAAVSLDGGFTFLVRENVQLDLAGGAGLSDEAADWFVGIGASARVPR